ALGVCASRRDGADGAIVGVAVVLLSLLTARRVVGAEAERTSALVRLMLGAEPARVAGLLARSQRQQGQSGQREQQEQQRQSGMPAEAPGAPAEPSEDGGLWTVVHGRRRGRGRDDGLLAT
ncbi:hypothetical protein GTZ78_58520, partial [Streptomyces sp. SID8361]|nr:hypothetical protein [Streptomyces sp. SID8361]